MRTVIRPKNPLGNLPKCWSCKFYTKGLYEQDKGKGTALYADGYCHNPKRLRVGINGKVLKNPPDKEAVHSNCHCKQWIDVKSQDSYFDFVTGEVRRRIEGDSIA